MVFHLPVKLRMFLWGTGHVLLIGTAILPCILCAVPAFHSPLNIMLPVFWVLPFLCLSVPKYLASWRTQGPATQGQVEDPTRQLCLPTHQWTITVNRSSFWKALLGFQSAAKVENFRCNEWRTGFLGKKLKKWHGWHKPLFRIHVWGLRRI